MNTIDTINTSNPIHTEHWRGRLHFSPQRHWINDPNGLVWLEGEYHLYYQYNPFGDQWGHMSWGHAVSTDLLHWQELPVAIPEDERVSIFSGSVIVDTHNTSGFGDGISPVLVAIYTGCLRRPEGSQAQELAFSTDRGRTWTQYAHNPVLDLGLRDFRDPKVFWHAPTARWIMLAVVPDAHQIRFYASGDLKQWQELSRFDQPLDGQGIWECPDLIELPVDGGSDGETAWMLKVDVFEGHPSLGSGARVFFGHFDGTNFLADDSRLAHWADWGADFYAALSWANLPASPSRAVWIGWMNCHRYAKHLPTSPWRGSMSIPRELSLHRDAGGSLHLRQTPVRELNAERGRSIEIKALEVRGEQAWLPEDVDARMLDIELLIDPGTSDRCGLILRQGEGNETRVGIDRSQGTVFIDRARSGFIPPDDPHYAKRREAPCEALKQGRPVQLRVLLDHASVEVFADEGRVVLTEQILAPREAVSTRLFAQAGVAKVERAVIADLLGGS